MAQVDVIVLVNGYMKVHLCMTPHLNGFKNVCTIFTHAFICVICMLLTDVSFTASQLTTHLKGHKKVSTLTSFVSKDLCATF